MTGLLKKEINSALNTPLGYIPPLLFALIVNFLFVRDTFISGSVTFPSFFTVIMWAFVIFIPAMVMRTFSEEKRLNTIEVLLSLPVSEVEIVLAKFLSNMLFVIIALFLTLGVPVTLYKLSRIYLPEVMVGYTGCLFIGASFVAVGMFFSSITKNQIVSMLSTLITLLVLVSLSVELITSLLPPFIKDVLSYLSPVYHFQTFMKGIIDFRSLFYFAGITALFIFLTVMQIEKRD